MVPSNSLYKQIRDYSKEQKTDLKALWEDFLASEWKGHTYNDFVLINYVRGPKMTIPFYDRKQIIAFIYQKAEFAFKNWYFKEKIKTEDWRKPHYQALISYNRDMINKYNDLIFKILGGIES